MGMCYRDALKGCATVMCYVALLGVLRGEHLLKAIG